MNFPLNMNKIKHLLFLSAGICSAIILSSCTAGTNIGGFLSDIGVRKAYNIKPAPYTPKNTYKPEITATTDINAPQKQPHRKTCASTNWGTCTTWSSTSNTIK